MRLAELAPGDLVHSKVGEHEAYEVFIGWVTTPDGERPKGLPLPEECPEEIRVQRGRDAEGVVGHSQGGYYNGYKPNTRYAATVEVGGIRRRDFKRDTFYMHLWNNGRYLSPVDVERDIRRARWSAHRRIERTLENHDTAKLRWVVVPGLEFNAATLDSTWIDVENIEPVNGDHFIVIGPVGECRWLVRDTETDEQLEVDALDLYADWHDSFLLRHRERQASAATQDYREAARSALGRLDDTVDARAIKVSVEGVAMPWATVRALLEGRDGAGEAVMALVEAALYVGDCRVDAGLSPFARGFLLDDD